MKKYFLYILLLLPFLGFAQAQESTINTNIDYFKSHTFEPAQAGTTVTNIALSRMPSLALSASGTDTYTAPYNAKITSYVNLVTYPIIFANTNTGAATLNINGIGARPIRKNVSVALIAGDIVAGQPYQVTYNSITSVFMLSVLPGAGGGGGSSSFSSLTGATGVNSISNSNYQQTWTNTKININQSVSESLTGRNIVARGNSVTYGLGTTNPTLYNYATQTANLYNLSIDRIGVSGQTAVTYATTLLAQTPTYSAATHKFLLLEWGINDLAATATVFIGAMNTIIDDAQSKGWPSADIIVLSIPGSCTICNSTWVATSNAALLSACATQGVNYVNVTTPFTAITPGVSAYQNGTIHPNDQGAQLMANIIYGQIGRPSTVGTQTFINNGETQLNNIKFLNAPFIERPYNLAMDSLGNVGISNSLRRGTRTNGVFIINGQLRHQNSIDPTIGAGIKDWIMESNTSLWGTLSGSPDIYGKIKVFNSAGETEFSNNYGGITFLTATPTGTPVERLRITNTGNIINTPSSYWQTDVPASGGVYGRFELSDATGKTILSNNYGTGGIYFNVNDLGGGFNTNKSGLKIEPLGITSSFLSGSGTRQVVADLNGKLLTIPLPGTPNNTVITSGSSSTISTPSSGTAIVVLFNPASLLATYAATMPATPTDGTTIEYLFGGTITATNTVVTTFSIVPNSGQSLIQTITPTTAKAGDVFMYRYVASTSTWYRRF